MAGNFRHQVTKACFYGDVFREPPGEDGEPGRHDQVITNKPFSKNESELYEKERDEAGRKVAKEGRKYEPLPSYLEPLDYEFDKKGNPVVDERRLDDEPDEIDATPDAVTLAAEYAIDLETVEGSGKDGRIVKGDIQKIVDGE